MAACLTLILARQPGSQGAGNPPAEEHAHVLVGHCRPLDGDGVVTRQRCRQTRGLRQCPHISSRNSSASDRYEGLLPQPSGMLLRILDRAADKVCSECQDQLGSLNAR